MLVEPQARNPLLASSYGTGELIRHALDAGIRHIILGIGGSAMLMAVWGWPRHSACSFLTRKGRH